MRNVVNRFWLMCCSTMLLATYMLCFGSAITFNSTSVEGISMSRTAVVETTAVNDVRKDGVKEIIKEEKKLDLRGNVLLPLLPILFNGSDSESYTLVNIYGLDKSSDWNSTFIPSLGANAPPFTRC